MSPLENLMGWRVKSPLYAPYSKTSDILNSLSYEAHQNKKNIYS